MITIGESIRNTRLSKGLSQNKLAIISGVSVQNICNYEQNRSFATIINLIPLADALGVTLDELVGRTVESK
jgi:transcriptional regulator with XRE-family HTH domain